MKRLAFVATVVVPVACGGSLQRAQPSQAPAATSSAAPSQPTPRPLVSHEPMSGVVLVEEPGTWPWAVATPEDAGLRRDALERVVAEAERTGTDALLVLQGDRVVVARRFGKPAGAIELMSVTKGFVGIAIGFLLDEGKIPSLDTPLSRWFPEWGQGKKAKVTLRHVVSHTSGLAHAALGGQLAKQNNRLAYVRALPIETEPGDVFSYNNEATQLLSGVVAAAAREPLDAYLRKRLFEPLGITDFEWRRDAAGNVLASEGLSLTTEGLARVGVALRDEGKWKQAQVIPPSILARIKERVKKAPWHGMLAWLSYDGPWQVQSAERRAALAAEGFTSGDKLASLDGKRFASRAAYWMEAGALLTPAERERLGGMVRDDLVPFGQADGQLTGFNFNGWLGQYLVVHPGAGLVAVRQRREPPNVDDGSNKKIGMQSFPQLIRAALRDEIPVWR